MPGAPQGGTAPRMTAQKINLAGLASVRVGRVTLRDK